MRIRVLVSASASPGVCERECESRCYCARVRARVLMSASASPGVSERECGSGCQ